MGITGVNGWQQLTPEAHYLCPTPPYPPSGYGRGIEASRHPAGIEQQTSHNATRLMVISDFFHLRLGGASVGGGGGG